MPVSAALRDGIRHVAAHADLRVVPNVVDTDRFHPNGTPPPARATARLIGVGNLYEAKGWDALLDAVALVRGRGRAVHLDIYGDGVLRESLDEQIDRLGIRDLVVIHGWQPKTEVAARLREADLFVITSVYDSNPCAVIEALASGVPVVGTRVGGIPEMVTEEAGVLAGSRSPEDIAAAIEAALDRSWDRGEIAHSAKGRYGAERIGRDFAAVYDEALRRHR
jgi:glycosyltransferase involved in cell wall biosynthesis